ncbi:MAG: beta-lactamase family protein [Algicola sp.]|nr:beta-lactamase family protein [Algicola sp.]
MKINRPKISFVKPLIVLSIALLSGFTGLTTVQATEQSATQSALTKQQLKALNTVFKKLRKDSQLVGLQGAVFAGGKIVTQVNLGFADLEHNVPVNNNTRFEIASITKSFTGLGLLLLERQGKIDLDKPIQTYVPSFPVKTQGTITARLLTGNLSGIRSYNKVERTPAFYATHYDDVVVALDLFKDDPLLFTPGEKHKYTSYGYNLLAAAIQGASGERYRDYIQRTILQPLGLKNTGFIDVRKPMKHRSRMYSFVEPLTRAVQDHLSVIPTLEHSYNMGGGNMYSNAADLVTFGSQFLQAGLESKGLVSKDILQQIFTPQYTKSGQTSYVSNGWMVGGFDHSVKYLVMSGSYPGVQAHLIVYPTQGVAFAYATNTWGKEGGASFGPDGSVTRLAHRVGEILASSQTK